MSVIGRKSAQPAASTGPKKAEAIVNAAIKAAPDQLPFSNRDDFAGAECGLMATIPDALIKDVVILAVGRRFPKH
jgi:alkyl sulfatase BDS1-like metallo-beta-lactamase superfamily hydrolase